MPNRGDETHTCHITHSSCGLGGLVAWAQGPTPPLSSEVHLPFPASSALPHPIHCITRTLPGISFFKSLAHPDRHVSTRLQQPAMPRAHSDTTNKLFHIPRDLFPLKTFLCGPFSCFSNRSGGPWSSGHKTLLHQALQALPAKDHVCSQLRNSLLWGAQF